MLLLLKRVPGAELCDPLKPVPGRVLKEHAEPLEGRLTAKRGPRLPSLL